MTDDSNSSSDSESASDRAERAERARKVAKAWDDSAAADAWRGGYHPMGEITRIPDGGWRDEADKKAILFRSIVLRGTLPTTVPKRAKVRWESGDSLSRPMESAKRAFGDLAGGNPTEGPYLTVTRVELGEMTVATTRGPATVPAWMFTIDGYDTPLKRAAAIASELPAPPVKRDGNVSGDPGDVVDRLVQVSPGGRALTVVVSPAGACADWAGADVLETSGSVVLSGFTEERKKRKENDVCAKRDDGHQVTVKLDKPLGDRVLLDAVTGRPVPFKPQLGRRPISWS
ncbi:hypothetical protein U9R90_30590 [Streptomyces sp. E11-3]|uniref:hypothetical protein n=1 Tax=Streptomyces sp. E11-3 TaxID=3110112 RepID=UPI00397FECE8